MKKKHKSEFLREEPSNTLPKLKTNPYIKCLFDRCDKAMKTTKER